MWTLEEQARRRYVHGMTRLGTWYIRLLLERGEVRSEDLPTALSQRVDLYRFTDLWNGTSDSQDGVADPEWMRLSTRIARLVRETSFAEVSGLEDQVLALLEPTLEARLPKDVGPPPVRPYGCWTYDLGWAGLADRPGRLGRFANPTHVAAILRSRLGLQPSPSRDCVLHIMNVLVPRSPFDDLPSLAFSLRELVAHVRNEHPQVRELWCNTWLNEHPKFHEIFPGVWFRNATVAPPGNHRNWWGQFARRNGDFNEAAAQQFRSSGGVFPFRALRCHAGIGEIEQHLCRSFHLPC